MTAPNGPRTFGNSPDSQLRHMQYPKIPRCFRLWQKQRGISFPDLKAATFRRMNILRESR